MTSLPPLSQRQQRLDFKVDVNFESEHNFFMGFTENVSEGGLFVATHSLLPAGAIVEIEFQMPGSAKAIRAKAEVRWLREYREGNDAPPGMGLRFIAVSPEDQRTIATFLTQRQPIFYDE